MRNGGNEKGAANCRLRAYGLRALAALLLVAFLAFGVTTYILLKNALTATASPRRG